MTSIKPEKQEKYKILVMAILLAGACFLTYYFRAVVKTGIIFTHLFYIPIILAALWWKRKGLVVAIFLAALLITAHFLIVLNQEIINDFLRASMFILVGLVTVILSERMAKSAEELRRLTEELRKERDYTRHLMESSPDFQMTLDKDGRIMDVNEAFEVIIGKARGSIIGSSIYEYLPKKETEKAIVEILEKEKVRDIELTAHIPGKGDLILNLSGTVFTTPEGETGVYTTGRDITEFREKETQLIHAGRLASIGEMATGVAHEINQPLSVIFLVVQGILRDVKKKRFDINRFSEGLNDMMANLRRINLIITHMRKFTRKPEELGTVKPEEVIDNAFILLDAQFRVHKISVSYEIKDNLPLIEVDANQLEQAFVDMLVNARQALDKQEEKAKNKGEIFEKKLVCRISREKENEHEWVVFEFADNAYGVPDKLKTKIFESFFTTKKSGEGTGLGLSIAYNIVTRLLGGKIWVEDNEMGGASFKVMLPIKDSGSGDSG